MNRIVKYDYDLFVIGAGSGGVRAARVSAALGARVAIAEERYLGGTCVNVGCVPKKLFVYGSHFREDFEDARNYGWTLQGAQFDWQVLRDNKTAEIERLNGIYQGLLDNAGVTIFDGHARLVDDHTIEIEGEKYSSERILITTGSWPAIPTFPGCELVLNSNDTFYLERLPERIVIVGGGYISVEFAGIYSALGVDTTLLYRGPLFLRGFDDSVREFVCDELRKKNVEILFNAEVESVKGELTEKLVILKDGSEIVTDEVLYATGRNPLTKNLGLENTQVKLRKNGAIEVNERFATNVPHMYALGDVIDRYQLTPVAIAEAMTFAHNTFGESTEPTDYSVIPTAVFCQPNIGTVGPTESEARAKFDRVDVYESKFKPMKHTISGRDERTYMKLLVEHETDRVVAAHMVGPDAGEIIQGIAVAVHAQATKTDFDNTVGIHPTAAEEFVTMREASR